MRRRAFLLIAVAAAAAPGAALAGGAPGGKKKGGGQSFIQFPTLTATVVRADGRPGVMTVEAGIDVADETLRETARRTVPRLRDAYAVELQRFAAALRPGRAPDADALAATLQRATDAVLGTTGAKLLLGSVIAP